MEDRIGVAAGDRADILDDHRKVIDPVTGQALDRWSIELQGHQHTIGLGPISWFIEECKVSGLQHLPVHPAKDGRG